MRKQNRRYAKEFKQEAIQLAASSDKGLAEIERELWITPGRLSAWRKKYQVNGETQSLELTDLAAAQAEIKRLRGELDRTHPAMPIPRRCSCGCPSRRHGACFGWPVLPRGKFTFGLTVSAPSPVFARQTGDLQDTVAEQILFFRGQRALFDVGDALDIIHGPDDADRHLEVALVE